MPASPQKPVLTEREIKTLQEAHAVHVEAARNGEKVVSLDDQVSFA